MFDDLFSSSRGPGVIGLLLGIIVLAGFCGLGFAVFDGRLNGDFANKRNQESATNEQRIANLKTQIANNNENRESWRKLQQDAKAAEEVRRAVELRKPKVVELKGQVKAEENKNVAARAFWENYKEQYRAFARERLVGTEIEKLVTADGKTFENVRVTSVTPYEIKFSHANGATGVKLATLDEKLKDVLQFSEEKAEEVAAEIRKNAELLGKTASAARKVAAFKARISHYNLNIERNNKKIAANDRTKLSNTAEAERLREQARLNWVKYREDKDAGRPSRADDNARNAERQADNLLRANQALNTTRAKLRQENSDLQGKIGDTQREMAQTIREAKEQAAEAKEEQAEARDAAASP